MKKIVLAISIIGMSVTSVFAYDASFTNNTDKTISITTGDTTVSTVSASKTVNLELDPYAAYTFNYQGQWAMQGLGTIQKYTNIVYQITPAAVVDTAINVSITADGETGITTNKTGTEPSGICADDTGGITCTLSSGDNLDNLTITFDPKS